MFPSEKILIKDLFEYSFMRQLERNRKERGREERFKREIFLDSLPQWLQWLGLSQDKVKIQELDPDCPHGWQGPKQWGHLLLPPQVQ